MRQLAAALHSEEASVREACARLNAALTGIVLQKATGELLFAAPFSAAASTFQVEVNSKRWFAPCGWDAFGIVALLGGSGTIHTSCPCCGETITIPVSNGHLGDANGWMNLVVPARRFWEDVVFT